MSLTKEMIMFVDREIDSLNDDMLKVYNSTYRSLNNEYPNSYFGYRIKKSDEELITRGHKEYVSSLYN